MLTKHVIESFFRIFTLLVLASTLYQCDVTVGHMSGLNYLLLSLPFILHLFTLACRFVHLICQLGSALHFWLCIPLLSLFFLVFAFLFLSLALQYTSFCIYHVWSIIKVSYLHVCIFRILTWQYLPYIYLWLLQG